MKDYYKILGLVDSATPDEIRRAYRILVRRYHPDLNPGRNTEARFQEIVESYEVLSDPKKRRRYDVQREAGNIKSALSNAAGIQRRAHHSYRTDDTQYQKTLWDDLRVGFKSFWRNAKSDLNQMYQELRCKFKKKASSNQSKKPSKKAKVSKISVVEVTIGVEDAIKGVRRKVEIRGENEIRDISVDIPAGVRNGSVLRLKNKADQSEELILIIRLASHSFLSIQPKGLVVEIPISIHEALYGAQICVPGIDEEILITVPPSSQSGDEIRVVGKGIKNSQGHRGDIFYRLMIKAPEYPEAVGLKEKAVMIEEYYSSNVRSRLPKTLV